MTYKDLYAQAKIAGALATCEPTFVKLEKPGDFLIGKLVNVDEVESAQGPGVFKMYVFQTDDGLIKTKTGSATDRMAGKYLKIGHIYRMEFLGQNKLASGVSVNRFRIEEITLPGIEIGNDTSAAAPL